MSSQAHMLFGSGPPRSFAARARNSRALVRAVASQDPNSFYAGAIVRTGDYVTVERSSEPGSYPVVMAANGIVVVRAGGDPTRQLVRAEAYSRRLQMWTGDSQQYINNHAPVGGLFALELVVGVPMTVYSLLDRFTDADGDDLTLVSISGDLPSGTSEVHGFLSGTPDTIGSGFFQILARDPAGALGIAQVNWTVLAAPPPPPAAGGLTEYIRVKTAIGGTLTGN